MCGWPAMVMVIGSELWSIWMLLANCFCSALIVSPPLPITRPTMPLGHSSTRETPAPNCRVRCGRQCTHPIQPASGFDKNASVMLVVVLPSAEIVV